MLCNWMTELFLTCDGFLSSAPFQMHATVSQNTERMIPGSNPTPLTVSWMPSPQLLRLILTPDCRSFSLYLYSFDHHHFDHDWYWPLLCGQTAFNPHGSQWHSHRNSRAPSPYQQFLCIFFCYLSKRKHEKDLSSPFVPMYVLFYFFGIWLGGAFLATARALYIEGTFINIL